MKNNEFPKWEDVKDVWFTEEERINGELRAALMTEVISARQEKGVTQRELSELTGVKQPVIARLESGASIPNVNTLIKVLLPLGKTIRVVDL